MDHSWNAIPAPRISRQNEIVMMGVASDGAYGVPEGMILSLPVTCPGDGTYKIVHDLPLTDAARAAIAAAVADLQSELAEANAFLQDAS